MAPTNQTNSVVQVTEINPLFEIEDLRNQNILFQSVSRYETCLEQPRHPYLRLVTSNTIQNWINYFSINNNIYSKGLERINNWRNLFHSRHFLYLQQNIKYFVLSALIILFQVYGDGNHRTASYFYKKHTGCDLNLELIDGLLIGGLVIEFSTLNTNSINHLIEQLIIISESQQPM